MTRRLTGLGWDHPRGFDCLTASARAFHEINPDIEITWEARSLRDFGEAPIEPLARDYDLIVIDHPFSGQARASGCLHDLGTLMPKTVRAAEADEIGQSTRSYQYHGATWGLPTDATSQVAAYRPDIFARHDLAVPRTHEEVLSLARRLRARGAWIVVPSAPIDAICQVLSYAANLGDPPGADPGRFARRETLADVLDLLVELVGLAHPTSLDVNPIQAYEAMASADDLAYSPLLFGYSNYARVGRDRVVLGANFAGPGPVAHAGALLGGAGCAITAACREVEAACSYLAWLHRPETLRDVYFPAGGQPGRRSIWQNTDVNADASGFFEATLSTLEAAYLRPRFPGFVTFMEEGGKRVARFLSRKGGRDATLDYLLAEYTRAWETYQRDS